MIRHADPQRGYLSHKREIDEAITRVLEGGRYILGPEVSQFEKEWAQYLGVNQAIGVANGTDALELALRALEIGPGDLVVTASNTAVATVAAIELAGAAPLLVDVDPETLTLSPARLEQALECNRDRRIKAVIPVHLYGQPALIAEIVALAANHGVAVIEDCAQAHGAIVDGRKVGTFGIAAAFSFYPTKNLAALGDGGAVVTNDAALAERLTELRVYGWRARYISERTGMNTRLDDLQAAILRVKLRYLDAENARRREIAAQYDRALSGLPITLPSRGRGEEHAFHQYVVRTSERDALRRRLAEQQIETAILYPIPIHEQPAYRGRVAISDALTVTEEAARELLCLPIHPALSEANVQRVVDTIIRSLAR